MRVDLKVLWLVQRRDESARPVSRASVDHAVDSLSTSAAACFPDHDVTVSLCSTDHNVRGASELISRADGCHLAVVDITGTDPDVFFALGLLASRNVPVVLIEDAEESTGLHGRLPLAESRIVPVADYASLPAEIHRTVEVAVRQLLHYPSVPLSDLKALWFPTDRGDIHVLAATEDQPTPYTDLSDPNYIYIDSLIDRDTLVGVYGFLRRYYPERDVIMTAAEEIAVQRRLYIEGDLVVIGGPGVPDHGIVGNPLCRLMTDNARCSVEYSSDGTQAIFGGDTWTAEYTASERLKRDFGYFARFANPFNPSRSVVMIHGLHTLGVYGAFQAFSDHPAAYANVTAAIEDFGPNGAFESGFFVEVHEGSVRCPTGVTGVRVSPTAQTPGQRTEGRGAP